MEPKYSVESINSFEEFEKLNLYLITKKEAILVILYIAFTLFLGFTTKKVIWYVVSVVFPIVLFILIKTSIKNTFNKNKNYIDLKSTINFYEDHLEQTNEYGDFKITYDKIYKVIDKKENIYLSIAEGRYINIIKKNCSPELIDFINTRIKK